MNHQRRLDFVTVKQLVDLLKALPVDPGLDDSQTVVELRSIRLEYQRVMGILA